MGVQYRRWNPSKIPHAHADWGPTVQVVHAADEHAWTSEHLYDSAMLVKGSRVEGPPYTQRSCDRVEHFLAVSFGTLLFSYSAKVCLNAM